VKKVKVKKQSFFGLMVGICRRNCEAEVRMQSKAEVAKATKLLSAVTIYVFFLSFFLMATVMSQV